MEVRVLGPVELVDDSKVVRLAPAERTLLAALASRAGERVAVDVLEEALWPEQPPATARKTLQGHVMRLRRVLGPDAVVERGGGYLLDPAGVGVDAGRITALVRTARDAIRGGHPDDAIAILDEARAAFRGEPYADVPDTAVPAGEVQRLQDLRGAVIEEAFEAELACGHGDRVVGELESFVANHPYRERAWGQLMVAHYQAGRAADALAAYGRARVTLAAELGIEPGSALRAVEQAVLTHDPRLLRNVPGRVGLGPSNLPAAVSPIIGREDDLAALDRLLDDHRLVTLTGIGGIGKTRLAVEIAARAAPRYAHGPYFCDLIPLSDSDLVPAALAAALGIPVEAHDDVVERIGAELAGYPVVAVFDNCEHLLPGVAERIASLLALVPDVRVVATCREPLDVAGERVWPLDPLDVPAAGSSSDQIRDSESAALFLARLPANEAAPTLDPEDLAAIGAICRSLDGMPLALELAAARSRTLSLSDLADRLDRSISELALPGHGVAPRHRSMRAALDWGYHLLTPSAQEALRAMSVFAGGCDLAGFTNVCIDDPDTALDVIDELVRTSFAVADTTHCPARYRLLEPVRQYAAELLGGEADHDDRRNRHFQHFSRFARTLSEHEDETGNVPLGPLLGELGNLRVALDWAHGAPELTEGGLVLASDLFHLWNDSVHHAEGVARIAALLGTGGGTPETRSDSARIAGIVAANGGDIDRGRDFSEQALIEARRGTDVAVERRARQILAQITLGLGDVAAARGHLEPALTGRQHDDADAFCLVTKAHIDLVAADLDDAAAAARDVLTGPFGSLGWAGTTARYVLGSIAFERGEYAIVRSWFTDGLTLAEAQGDSHTVVDFHLDLLRTECASGRIDDARAHFEVASNRRPDTVPWDLRFLQVGAELALHGGSPGDAVGLAGGALALANRGGDALERSAILRVLGDAHLAAHDPNSALSTFQQLIVRAAAIPSPCRLAEGHEGAAAAAGALGHQHEAHRHLAAASEIRRRTNTRRWRRPGVENQLVTLESVFGLDARSV